MTHFQQLVIRLLVMIAKKTLMLRGVATYDSDKDLIKEAEEAL